MSKKKPSHQQDRVKASPDAVTVKNRDGTGATSSSARPAMQNEGRKGDISDTYEILGQIGSGGFGEVLRARHKLLNRQVAIKMLRAEFGSDERFRRRFQQEARVLATVDHPNIVTVHDYGEVDDGRLFFAMELVEGGTLRSRLKEEKTLPVLEALRFFREMCSGLARVHENKIVHRDLKPENVMIGRQGEAKLVDFGIARDMRIGARDGLSGEQWGTVQYMAPEQKLAGGEITPRTDVFTLGLIFYEMLTGIVPVGAFDPLSTQIGTSAALDGIVRRCLQSDPEKRFADAGELLRAVENVEKGSRDGFVFSRRQLLSGAAGLLVIYAGAQALWNRALNLLGQSTKKEVEGAALTALGGGRFKLTGTGGGSKIIRVAIRPTTAKTINPAKASLDLVCTSTHAIRDFGVEMKGENGSLLFKNEKTVEKPKWDKKFPLDKFKRQPEGGGDFQVNEVILIFEFGAALSTEIEPFMVIEKLDLMQ